MVLTDRQKTLLYVLTLFIMPLSGASIDLYSPSFPSMTHSFATTRALIQLNASVYLLGYGLFQIIVGPIIDARGRRSYMTWGLAAYVVVGVLCAWSSTVSVLLALRFCQGIAIAFINTIARVVVNDIYTGEEFLKKVTLIPICWALGPIVAPVIGGYIQHHFDWQFNFYFLSGYALLLLIFSLLFFAETIPSKTRIHLQQSLKNYQTIVINKEFVGSAMLCGLAYGCLIVFSLIGPFMVQAELHYTAVVFGFTQLFIGVCWLIGNIVCRKTVAVPVLKRTKLELIGLSLSSVIMIIIGMLGLLTLPVLILAFVGLIFFGGTLFPAMLGNAMHLFVGSKVSGSAAALFGVITMTVTALVSALSTVLKAKSLLPTSVFFICLSVAAWFVFQLLIKPYHIKTTS